MTEIHPTAIVDKKARIDTDVSIGPFTIVEGDVEIGSGTQIHSHALIAGGARIGRNCEVHHASVLGTPPQDLKFGGEKTLLEIGDNTIIREHCDLNRGTSHTGKSTVGKNCYVMAYCHVAHDCVVGDNVIMANGVQLAGHVTIEDYVIIGGIVPIHQFCTVGQHSFIGGGFRVTQDVPPYILAAGYPISYKGLNIVGLKRRGFNPESIAALRKAYRFIYRSKMNTTKALDKIHAEIDICPEVQNVIDFIQQSERGLIR